ncbi:MAG: hydantoinase/oxoprolinase N-terminal domain-containing protein [Rhodospirillales bacterium]
MKWQFWIDRGGTFTDIVARAPDGGLRTAKLLSEDPARYGDAAIEGIRRILNLAPAEPIPAAQIEAVRWARRSRPTRCWSGAATASSSPLPGFADARASATRIRPKLFACHIVLPSMLYERVIEIDERLDAHGRVLTPFDEAAARAALEGAYAAGIRGIAIVLLHGYRHPDHEQRQWRRSPAPSASPRFPSVTASAH